MFQSMIDDQDEFEMSGEESGGRGGGVKKRRYSITTLFWGKSKSWPWPPTALGETKEMGGEEEAWVC